MLKLPQIAVECLKNNEGLWLHSMDVYLLCKRAMQFLPGDFLTNSPEDLLAAALFHDLGKSLWPKGWFEAPRDQLQREWTVMCNHPLTGAEILRGIWPGSSDGVLELIRSHHERPGVRGYPCGMKQINNDVLLIAACDVFSACTTVRRYRPKPLSAAQALAEVEKFAPEEVVRSLRSALELTKPAGKIHEKEVLAWNTTPA